MVDKRIRVYWPLDKSWYEGYVKSYYEDSGKHLVEYDDFEEEVLDLGKEKIEWVEETVKKFKRLRRGSLSFKKTVIEDEIEEMEDVGNIEEGNDGDDSSDEDWGKNPEMDVSDEGDMDLGDEQEVDNDRVGKNEKQGGKSESRKRKVCGAGKLVCGKKSEDTGNVSKKELKVSVVEQVKNKGDFLLLSLPFIFIMFVVLLLLVLVYYYHSFGGACNLYINMSTVFWLGLVKSMTR